MVGVGVASAMLLGASTTCNRSSPPPAPPPPPPQAKPVTHAAVADDDLRVMVAELAASKACTMIRGQFRPLRDPQRPTIVTGIFWIRACDITQTGTKVTFQLTGDGWQWADQKTKKAGGTFAVRQHVRFHVTSRLPGALDIAYAQGPHVVSIWFTPSATPEVKVTTIGGIDVDEQGLWSSVVGGVSSVFAS